MRIRTRVAAAVSAVTLAATVLTACGSGTGGSGGTDNQQPAPQTSYCSIYATNCGPQPSMAVSVNPQPTNPGVGQVSGICHFSITGPSGDNGAGGSGLRAKKMSPVLINLAGIVWGYCTDTIHDFTLDLHIYGGPPGTHDSGGDFTKNKHAHELSYREVKSPVPGPIPVPYAITMPCVPGLELQLVYTVTARDEAGNFIGVGPSGGNIVQFTAADCGAAS